MPKHAARMAASAHSSAANHQEPKKRKRRRHKDEIPDWDEESRSDEMDEETHPGRLTLVVGLVLLAAVMAIVIFAMKIGETQPPPQITIDAPELDDAQAADSTPTEVADEAPSTSRRTLNQFVNEARSAATTFLTATTVDDLLEIVAQPALMEPKIRKYYPDGTVDALGLASYSQFAQVETTEAYVIAQLHTANHSARLMTFLEGADGLKVDWESWVGWSEISMQSFIENRPSGRHQFRVQLGAVDYYNFDFSNDQQWQSFRLASPDGEHSLFGYAERGSPAHIRVREALDSGLTQILVEVELPAGEDPSGRQVIITDVLSNNWIHPDRIARP